MKITKKGSVSAVEQSVKHIQSAIQSLSVLAATNSVAKEALINLSVVAADLRANISDSRR